MRDERLLWAIVLIAAIAAGLLAGRHVHQQAPLPKADAVDMRGWFWQHRSLDLVIQVGLILSGALGIAALLPDGEEER